MDLWNILCISGFSLPRQLFVTLQDLQFGCTTGFPHCQRVSGGVLGFLSLPGKAVVVGAV